MQTGLKLFYLNISIFFIIKYKWLEHKFYQVAKISQKEAEYTDQALFHQFDIHACITYIYHFCAYKINQICQEFCCSSIYF